MIAVEDGADLLVALLVGVVAGMAVERTLRRFRDLGRARRQHAEARHIAWRSVPRMLVLGFFAFSLAVAALRRLT